MFFPFTNYKTVNVSSSSSTDVYTTTARSLMVVEATGGSIDGEWELATKNNVGDARVVIYRRLDVIINSSFNDTTIVTGAPVIVPAGQIIRLTTNGGVSFRLNIFELP